MDKAVISVFGTDRPGIVAAVSRVLFEKGCNIEDVSQTTLQTEFLGIFVVPVPGDLQLEELGKALEDGLEPLGLRVFLKRMEPSQEGVPQKAAEPFVITTTGPDRTGLVAGITEVMARYEVNITNLRAAFRGGDDPSRNIMIYEVDIPEAIDQQAFRHDLREKAEALGLDLSIQHRDIFEAINRV